MMTPSRQFSLRHYFTVLLIGFVWVVGVHAVERGSIIPLYIYPISTNGSDAWKPLTDAIKEYPIEVWAILNVDNGPGASKDANYVTAISNVKKAGVNILGYVYTNYTRRSMSKVRGDIDNWKRWYNPHGIFFDEMTNDDVGSHISYYQNLDSYAKSKGFIFTVGNPGTQVPRKYFSAVDTVMIYERQGYPPDEVTCKPSNKNTEALGIFPYNVPELNATNILRTKECIGYIYVTNDSGVNPWDTLPPYLLDLFELLSRE